MITIIFNNLKVPAGVFSYTFNCKTDLFSEVIYNNEVIEFGEFKFGSDGFDNELRFKAANTNFKFHVNSMGLWNKIVNSFFTSETTVDITLNRLPVFSGVVDCESVSGSYFEQIISVTITDSFIEKPPLIDRDCVSIGTSLGRPSAEEDLNNRVIPLVQLIGKLSYEYFGLMLSQKCRTRLRYYLWDYSEYFDTYIGDGSGLRQIAGCYGNLLSPSLYGYDAKKMIKSLCNVLCSYAITGFDKKLYILPLYYRGKNSGYDADPDLITITKEMFAGDPEPFCLKNKKYLKVNYLTDKKYFDGSNSWSVYYLPEEPDPDIVNDNEIEEIFLPLYAGSVDNNNGWSKTAFHIDVNNPNYICALGTDKTSFYKEGNFTGEGPLGYLSSYYIHSFLNRFKTGYKLTLEGTNYAVYNVFKMPGDEKIYRVKRIEYDFIENKTFLEILEH